MSLLDLATTFLTGGAGGAVARLFAEGVKLWQAKGDRDHEYRMRQLDRDIAKEGAEGNLRLAEAQGAATVDAKQVDAYIEALRGQAVKTGIAIVDALNALVRPFMAYYVYGLYGAYKLATLFMALDGGGVFWQAVADLWTPFDEALLSTITSFFLVGRVFDRSTRTR